MLSLVIPIYNEVRLINELVRRSAGALDAITGNYEIIFVDDGSTDDSLRLLLEAQSQNRKIKIVCLSRNFGHQAAFTAGLEIAKGDIVAMMDGDLQDPPELLAEMYRYITEEGYDVVSGRKTGRKGKGSHRKFALLFHLLFRNIGDAGDIKNYGNFSMMTREALNALLSLKEKIRYLPGLRSFIGFKQGYVDFVRDKRYGGKPKMSTRKLFMLAFDAIFSFSKLPIQLCLFIGTAGITLFFIAGLYYLATIIFSMVVPAWSPVMISIFFLASVQLFFVGIIGEYIFRNYKESQGRPVYFIKKVYDNSQDK